MVLALTTLERVKGVLDITGTDRDTVISDLINEVSAEAQNYMGRHNDSTRRTETYPLKANQTYLSLRGFPIDSVLFVKYAASRTFDDIDPLDVEQYDVMSGPGQIYFKPSGIAQWFVPGWAQVSYTGGLGVDADAAMTAFPSIAGAVTAEVVNRLNRSKNPEGNLRAFESGVAYEKPVQTLQRFYDALGSYRRVRT